MLFGYSELPQGFGLFSTVAEAATYEGFEYGLLRNGTIAITNYSGSESNVVIPDAIEGKKVTAIWNDAFENNSSLVSVSVPDSVSSIEEYAFENCKNLTGITLPSHLKKIGDCAFDDCISLASVSIPDSVTSIGASAFSSCKSLTSIVIPNKLSCIGYYVFSDCSSLTSIILPDSVTTIQYDSFKDCTKLTSITIPNSVTKIESSAFKNCIRLMELTLPQGQISINPSDFTPLYGRFGSFAGWYKDPDCINAWDFHTDQATTATTIYAKWVWNAGNFALKSVSTGYDSILLRWPAAKAAAGYDIFRSTSSTEGFTLVDSSAVPSWTDTAADTGTKYYYKVRAFKCSGQVKAYSNDSSVINGKAVPEIPWNLKAAKQNTKITNITWSQVDGASGYEVYRAASSNGKYKKIGTTVSASFADSNRNDSKDYFYKLRSYRTVGTGKVYSRWSAKIFVG